MLVKMHTPSEPVLVRYLILIASTFSALRVCTILQPLPHWASLGLLVYSRAKACGFLPNSLLLRSPE